MSPGSQPVTTTRRTRTGLRLSGIAPRAYLGNYKALGIPSQFGANGNSPELAAAIEAAVRDGMDVINLSLGETEIEPTPRRRGQRAECRCGRRRRCRQSRPATTSIEFGYGTITSPANAAKAISVAASSGGHGSRRRGQHRRASPPPARRPTRSRSSLTSPPQAKSVASAAPGGGFVELSGTSMSAPHVAGAAAVLRQRHPTWTPAQIKSALVLTGDPVHSGSTAEVNPLA